MVNLSKRGRAAHAVFPALLLLCGCATVYTPPTTGPTARLLVRSQSLTGGINVLETFDGAQDCSGPRILGTSASGSIDFATAIKADQPVSLRIRYTGDKKVCSYIVTFDAKAGRKYDVAPFSNSERCGMAVFDVTTGDRVPEPSARKRTLTGYVSGGFCTSPASTPVVQEASGPSLNDLRDLLPEGELK